MGKDFTKDMLDPTVEKTKKVIKLEEWENYESTLVFDLSDSEGTTERLFVVDINKSENPLDILDYYYVDTFEAYNPIDLFEFMSFGIDVTFQDNIFTIEYLSSIYKDVELQYDYILDTDGILVVFRKHEIESEIEEEIKEVTMTPLLTSAMLLF